MYVYKIKRGLRGIGGWKEGRKRRENRKGKRGRKKGWGGKVCLGAKDRTCYLDKIRPYKKSRPSVIEDLFPEIWQHLFFCIKVIHVDK